MVQIAQSEMHLLVLICMNSNHPNLDELIGGLSDDAKAIALIVLSRIRHSRIPPQLPESVNKDARKKAEVEAAANEFAKMVAGRRREQELRAGRRVAVPA
jgi:hypothetical protein